MEKVTLSLPDIACGYCLTVIKRVVLKVPGCRSCVGDVVSKQVTIAYDPNVESLAAIEDALGRLGYLTEEQDTFNS